MIPQQREMVKKLENKPFTLLGINSDPDRSVLNKRFKEEKITWPNICEGSGGAISNQFNVRMYPTVFVLDHEGIIRHRNLHDAELERAVNELIKKAPG